MKQLLHVILLLLFSVSVKAQEDLMAMLEENSDKEVNYTTATFKSTRVMNGHSVEKMPPGQLDFRISHRFGPLNSGAYNFFGLDQSNIHFSLEYGILKWLMAGVGRASFEKTYDGFTKFTIMRQSSGATIIPVSVSAVTTAALKTLKFPDQDRDNYFSSRLSYTAQILIARKINQSMSLQLTPSYVHRNLVATELDPNDLYSVGIGGRLKLTSRISLNGEYYYLINLSKDLTRQIYNPLSVGFDIETGGHVFQLMFTNSLGMAEKAFIGETTGSWKKGDIHFGFNISRVFTLKPYSTKTNY